MSKQQSQVRSWRSGPSVDENSPATRRTIIVFLAIVLVIAGIVIWNKIKPIPREELFFTALRVDSYESVVPDIYATATDLKQLEVPNEERLSYNWIPIPPLQSKETIQEIGPELRVALEASEQHDAVFIYIAAHGIGHQGKAYLLGSNFTGENNTGMCDVRVVLDAVKTLPTKTKILFFDCGHFETDARFGLFFNSFPYFLEREMAALDDDTVWAITSNQLLQVANTSTRGDKFHSIFSQAVQSSLQPEADSLDAEASLDNELTLGELYEHILRKCHVQTSGNPQQIVQTPMLLRGGTGLSAIEPAEEIVLGEFPPPNPPEEVDGGETKPPEDEKTARRSGASFHTAKFAMGTIGPQWAVNALGIQNTNDSPETKKEGPANPPAEQPAKDSTPATDPATPTDPASPTTPTAPGPASPPPSEPEWDGPPQLKELYEVWRLRDELQSRGEENRDWSPVDFAPHLWRALNYRLVNLELRLRHDATDQNAQRDIQTTRTNLLDLQKAVATNRAANDRGNVSQTPDVRLVTAWNDFVRSPKKIAWEAAHSLHDDTKMRIRIYSDAHYNLRDYLRWYEQVSRGQAVVPGNPSKDLLQLIRLLETNRGEFEAQSFEPASKLNTSPGRRAMVAAADRIKQLDTTIADSIGTQLNDEGLPASPQSYFSKALSNGSSFFGDFQMEALLGSPLLSADARKLAYNFAGKTVLEFEIDRDTPIATLRGVKENQGNAVAWSRAADRAALYVAFLRLAGNGYNITTSAPPAELEEAVKHFEDLGMKVRQKLANLVNGAKESTAKNWRQATMLDPRDLNRWDENLATLPAVRFVVPKQATQITLAGPDKIELQRVGEKRQFALDITANNPAPTSDMLTVTVGRDEIADVDLFDFFNIRFGNQQLKVGSTFQIPFNSKQIPLEISTTGDRDSADGKDLFIITVQVSDDQGSRKDWEVTLVPPLPDEIELFVRQTESPQLIRNESAHERFGDIVRLNPFPTKTHPTEFECYLVNRSGTDKNLRVTVYPVSRPSTLVLRPGMVADYDQVIPRSLINHMDDRIRDRIILPMATTSLSLAATTLDSADYKTVREVETAPATAMLTLAPPTAPAPAEGETPAKPAEKPEPPNAEYGLLCLIEELGEGENPTAVKQWKKWIEIQPLDPGNYIQTPIVSYNPNTAEIEVVVAVKPDKIVWEKVESIPVSWDVYQNGTIEPLSILGEINANEQSVKLLSKLKNRLGPNQEIDITIPLTVDGYPRAFTMLVKCRGIGDAKVTDITQSRKIVDIPQPLFKGEDDTPIKSEMILKHDNRLAINDCDTIVITPRIDAPYSSLKKLYRREDGKIDERIDVFLHVYKNDPDNGDKRARFSVYSDREIKNFVETGKRGTLLIESQVSDHSFTLNTKGIQNTKLDVVAEMHVSDQVVTQKVPILLDSLAPLKSAISSNLATPVIEQGKPLEIRLSTKDDGTKVTNVIFAFDDNKSNNMIFDEGDKAFEGRPIEKNNMWVLPIPTKMLKVGPKYIVVARSEDMLGNKCDNHQAFEFVVAPSENSPDNLAKKRFILRVAVVDDSGGPFRAIDKVEVTIKGLPTKPKPVDNLFVFKELPAKKYEINAFADLNLYDYEGSAEVEISPELPTKKPIDVTIRMKKKK